MKARDLRRSGCGRCLSGGTVWVCSMGKSGETEDGAAKLGGKARGTEPFIERLEERNELGFDGILYVGSTTASTPAGQPE